jgi:hypothetical protein
MSTEICLGFTDDQWKALKGRLIKGGVVQPDEESWRCAISVFERRIRERFLSCIEALEEADSRAYVPVADDAPADCSTLPNDSGKRVVVPGFAIMALCCLLLETLESFRDSKPKASKSSAPCTYPNGDCIRPKLSSSSLIREFLKRPSFGQAFVDHKTVQSFVDGIRNGIFHRAETRSWVIKRDKPKDQICERLPGGGYSLNRTEFYQALRKEFDTYVADLRDPRNAENADLRTCFVEKMDNIVEKC